VGARRHAREHIVGSPWKSQAPARDALNAAMRSYALVIERTLSSPQRRERAAPTRGGALKERLLQLTLYLTNEVVANIPSATIRHAWYRRALGVELGEGAKVLMHVTFSIRGRPKLGRPGISIGRRSLINQGCWLDGRGGLRIGENVNVSRGTWLLGGDHDIDGTAFDVRYAPMQIGDRAFFGSRAMVLAGLTIGEGAVVAAGALVTKDVAPYAVVAGVPARVVRTRSRDLRYELDYAPLFE
jgi:acetyltransferase-like isoleucine patch superfamily enzyme